MAEPEHDELESPVGPQRRCHDPPCDWCAKRSKPCLIQDSSPDSRMLVAACENCRRRKARCSLVGDNHPNHTSRTVSTRPFLELGNPNASHGSKADSQDADDLPPPPSPARTASRSNAYPPTFSVLSARSEDRGQTPVDADVPESLLRAKTEAEALLSRAQAKQAEKDVQLQNLSVQKERIMIELREIEQHEAIVRNERKKYEDQEDRARKNVANVARTIQEWSAPEAMEPASPQLPSPPPPPPPPPPTRTYNAAMGTGPPSHRKRPGFLPPGRVEWGGMSGEDERRGPPRPKSKSPETSDYGGRKRPRTNSYPDAYAEL